MPNFSTGHVVTNIEFNAVCPVGSVLPYVGSSAPTAWLVCDGSAVSRTTYADLFAVMGTAYGVGDGSTTFNVPDLRGRMPVGLGTHTDVSTLGNSDGLAVGSRRPKHKHTTSHTLTLPNHAHSLSPPVLVGGSSFANEGTGGGEATISATGNPTTTPAINGSVTVGPQTGSEPTDSTAYVTLNFIVKT